MFPTDVQYITLRLVYHMFCFAQSGVWETLLAALEILIREQHPQQAFNIQQLLKAQVVHRFLLTCQVLQVRPYLPQIQIPFTLSEKLYLHDLFPSTFSILTGESG